MGAQERINILGVACRAGELFIPLLQLGDERRCDGLLNKGSRGGDACLACVEEKTLAVVLERVVEVGISEDERGRFAA